MRNFASLSFFFLSSLYPFLQEKCVSGGFYIVFCFCFLGGVGWGGGGGGGGWGGVYAVLILDMKKQMLGCLLNVFVDDVKGFSLADNCDSACCADFSYAHARWPNSPTVFRCQFVCANVMSL